MPYKIHLDSTSAKVLKNFDAAKLVIKKALGELSETPIKAGESLYLSDYRKIRTGDYRAIYEINRKKQEVIVLFIGHRKNVYTDFSKIL
ncbi:MAG: type II toxin-antitoxin system RelE/ParE family toxin [Candidatus Pacebacteria bacterium]|nr:type II toxin-antitoxin system RelE/ParE family toxin [Candidatus Paceibacterota bacterium]MDD4326545.1 type II toxin-antitoxin system RelE/ParE family toxin [Candidatus Bathyarchaeota archaeon]MDI9578463.1 type II toxin-antitoxin system RelE/ParE family toxin [Thermoproteota archaeon]NLD65667.1 type II toxin-antitoxin system RelE/ParE family toxin [Thermoproteota archaeon]